MLLSIKIQDATNATTIQLGSGGFLLVQEFKEAGLVSPGNPQRSASSNKPQISGLGSHSKADKQATVSLTKKHAASLINKPQISGLGSHSKADKQAPVSLI